MEIPDESSAGAMQTFNPMFAKIHQEMRNDSIMTGKKLSNPYITLADFVIKLQIGQGTFGKVYLAQLPNLSKKFAIKVIRKDKLIETGAIDSTALEKDILFEADHPFLCGMEYFFQSETRLYFVLPFIGGGELFKIVKKRKILDESVVKFYAA